MRNELPRQAAAPLTLEASATLTGELVKFAASRICLSNRWFWHRKRSSCQKRYLDGIYLQDGQPEFPFLELTELEKREF